MPGTAPVRALSVPPAATISPNAKSEEDALRVKVMVAVSPDFNADLSDVIVTVGAATVAAAS